MRDVRLAEIGVLLAGPRDDTADRQPELLCERVVTLVVRGDGHDRAGSVAGEHVVGHEDRDSLAVDRVDRVGTDRDAGLLAFGGQPLDLGLGLGARDVRLHLRPSLRGRQRRDQRMLRGEDHERRSEQRVRARREDADLLAARVVVGRRGIEHDLAALRSADPVRLLDPDRVGKLNLAEVEQLVRVLRDAQVPLVQVSLLDLCAAAPAVTVGALDLLAGQRAVVRTPVDRRLRAVGEAGLQELQEEPLVPAVVVGVAGDDLGAPVERGAHLP